MGEKYGDSKSASVVRETWLGASMAIFTSVMRHGFCRVAGRTMGVGFGIGVDSGAAITAARVGRGNMMQLGGGYVGPSVT